MTNDSINNLPELRDIHLPTEGVSVFPLAEGWYVVLVVLLALFISYKIIKWIKKTSAKLYAKYLLRNLQQDTSLQAAVKISAILRRICLRKYPQAISLSGNQWVEFLNAHTKHSINGKSADLLKNAPYISETNPIYAPQLVEELKHFAYQWVGDNL